MKMIEYAKKGNIMSIKENYYIYQCKISQWINRRTKEHKRKR
jgi:hypothetical protein